MFNSIAIVRKFGTGAVEREVRHCAEKVHSHGTKLGVPVYDIHEGTSLPEDARKVLFVALGGDGTMLHAARESLKYPGSSLVGFNLGTLGFLVDDNKNDVKYFLREIKEGNAVKDKRMMIEVESGGEVRYALNEVLVSPLHINHMVQVEVFINDLPVTKYTGSGVLVSTSTGSTAMALSAGGAIISPSTNVMQIIPVMAHKLASNPIVTTGRDVICLKAVTNDPALGVTLATDGRQWRRPGEPHKTANLVTIQKHDTRVTIWRPEGWNFFNTLSTKMGWT